MHKNTGLERIRKLFLYIFKKMRIRCDFYNKAFDQSQKYDRSLLQASSSSMSLNYASCGKNSITQVCMQRAVFCIVYATV